MSRGPRSAPPELPGFTADRWIGGGGFADVFLYTQHRPSRSVAIKILRQEHLSTDTLAQFDAEADIMAEVSTHPYIVTIFSSGLSPDGRPFIVMEHYPKPHFGERARGGTLDVSEVLRTGIQVAGAVETAHRAGIVHRDIKPANILTSTFDRPGLTDFGISGVHTGGVLTAATGMTIAFSAPEVIAERSPGSIATDVYGLGATIAALAAGHSAFWSPDGNNTDQAILTRALAGTITPIARPDVPASLNHLVAQAMHIDPSHRPESALAFAQALQQVEQQLRLQPTPIDVAGIGGRARRTRADGADDDRTRRPIQVVDPDGPPSVADPRFPSERPSSSEPIAAPSTTPPAARLAPPTPTVPPVVFPGAPTGPTVNADVITAAPGATAADFRARSDAVVPGRTSSMEAADDHDETVARPGARTPSRPGAPYRRAAPEPPVPSAPRTPVAPAAEVGPLPPPRTRKPRHPFPWKPVAAVGAFAVAVVAVVAVFSAAGRNVSDDPQSRGTRSHAPPQSIVAGEEAGVPAVTPTDLALVPFSRGDDGAITSTMTWTAPDDPAVGFNIRVGPAGNRAQYETIRLTGDQVRTGRAEIRLSTDGAGTCTGLSVAGVPLPAATCEPGPPCFVVNASKPNTGLGDDVTALVPPDATIDAAAITLPNAYLPEAYAHACSHRSGAEG